MKLRQFVLLFALIVFGSFITQAKTFEFKLIRIIGDVGVYDWILTYDGKYAKLVENVFMNAQTDTRVVHETKISSTEISPKGTIGLYDDKGYLVFGVYAGDEGKTCAIVYRNSKREDVEFEDIRETPNKKFLSAYNELRAEVTGGKSGSTSTTPSGSSKSATSSLKVLSVKDFTEYPFGFLTVEKARTVASTQKALRSAGWPDKPSDNTLVSIENRSSFTIPYSFEGIPVRGMSSHYKNGVLWRYNLYCYRLKSEMSQTEMVNKAKGVVSQLKNMGFSVISTDSKKYPIYPWQKDYVYHYFVVLQKGKKKIHVMVEDGTDIKKKDSFVLRAYVTL